MTQDILIEKLKDVYHNYQELKNKNIMVLKSSYFNIFNPQSSYSVVRNAISTRQFQGYFASKYTREFEFLLRNFNNIIEDVNRQGVKDYFKDLNDKTDCQNLYRKILMRFNKLDPSFKLDHAIELNSWIHRFNRMYHWNNEKINSQILEITRRQYLKVLSEFHFYYIICTTK